MQLDIICLYFQSFRRGFSYFLVICNTECTGSEEQFSLFILHPSLNYRSCFKILTSVLFNCSKVQSVNIHNTDHWIYLQSYESLFSLAFSWFVCLFETFGSSWFYFGSFVWAWACASMCVFCCSRVWSPTNAGVGSFHEGAASIPVQKPLQVLVIVNSKLPFSRNNTLTTQIAKICRL